MDGATIQARIYAGRGKAALRIGLDCRQYRPLSTGAPLGNLVGTIKAAFNSGDNTYRAPNMPGDAYWGADLDGSVVQQGDYLVRVSDAQTWFVAGLQPLLPIICAECNRAIRITRQVAVMAVGAVGYSGMVPAQEVDVLGAPGALWPASLLLLGRKEKATDLPAGVKNAGWRLLLPPSVPITVMAGDIATDDLGRRYAIGSAEMTDLGWRMDANEVHS
jgi:hypothetical protein